MTKPSPHDEFSAQLAWEEYKLLQNKLDKLGDFRFRVKGWSHVPTEAEQIVTAVVSPLSAPTISN